MADYADRAEVLEQQARDDALRDQQRRASQRRRAAASAETCTDCDDPIPEGRRQAVPGCELCVSCQRRSEERNAR